MGQYWVIVNIDKKEFINPHKLGCGAKQLEIASSEVINIALVMLLSSHPEERGGGDFEIKGNSRRAIGRWAGDRIVIIGDYAEDTDIDLPVPASKLYDLCHASKTFTDISPMLREAIQETIPWVRFKYNKDSQVWEHEILY